MDSMRSSTGVDCFRGTAHSFLSPAYNRATMRQHLETKSLSAAREAWI
jgi:hypothetical protein